VLENRLVSPLEEELEEPEELLAPLVDVVEDAVEAAAVEEDEPPELELSLPPLLGALPPPPPPPPPERPPPPPPPLRPTETVMEAESAEPLMLTDIPC